MHYAHGIGRGSQAPYLAPVPLRGKINQPAYVCYIVEFLAKLKNIPLEVLQNSILENANKLNIFT